MDFPYYNGVPVQIAGRQWLFIVAAVVAGFLALLLTLPRFPSGPLAFLPALLFAAIPLAALALVTPRHWTALFRGVRARDVGWMAAFALLNIVVSLSVGYVVQKTAGVAPNAAISAIAGMTAGERVLYFLKVAAQLVGEEILTILPFLALLYWLHRRLALPRTTAIIGAWLLSALWFGAAHLPTYEWNLVQSFVVIGSARLVLTLPYMLTKNLWVSAGAHIFNDWLLLGMTLLGSALLPAGGT